MNPPDQPVTLAALRARLQAAQADYEAAEQARSEMGEPAFSWSAAAMDRVASTRADFHAAHRAVRGLELLEHPEKLTTLAEWSQAVGPLTGAANTASAQTRPFYEALLLETVRRLGLQGVQVRRDPATGAADYSYTRVRPRAWGNRLRFYSARTNLPRRLEERRCVVDSATQKIAGYAATEREAKTLIARLEAETPPPPEGAVEI